MVGGRARLLAGLAVAASSAASAGQRPWTPDRGDGTYRNPVLHADYSDPDVVRVGSDFYLVASSFNSVPGLPLLHSRDLVNWRLLNHALKRQVPEDVFSQPQHGKGVWAPALRFHAGRFRIYYPDPDFGIYLTTAQDPAGEWTPPVLVLPGKGLIDPCPLWDDDGSVYLVHAFARSRAGFNNVLRLVRLDADGTRALDEGRIVVDGNALPGYTTLEGPKLYKRGGYYYVFAPAGGVKSGWQSVFRSRRIDGPYEDRIVLHQGSTDVNGPHQGAWVDTPSGEHWFLHFQDREAYGRVVHLQPMRWSDDGWPVIGADPDGDGRGEPVAAARKPEATGIRTVSVPDTSDEFASRSLGLQWQWQANPRPEWVSLSERPGFLTLRSQPVASADNLWLAPNLLLQKWPARDFVATASLAFSPQLEGETAGLIVFGHDYAWIGLRRGQRGLRLSMRVCHEASAAGREREVAGLDLAQSRVFLRAAIAADGRVRFGYSLDGRRFEALGEEFAARAGHWVGAKVGLFAISTPGAPRRGHADVDWLRFDSAPPTPLPAFTVDDTERRLRKEYPGIQRLEGRLPAGVRQHRGVVYSGAAQRPLRLDLFMPEGAGRFPAVLVVFGGGWVSGRHDMENPFAMRLAERGYVAATPEYRLSGTAPFPAALHDLKAAVRWLRANAARHRIDPDRIAVVGGSAGGHLASLLGVTGDRRELEGDGGNAGVSSRVQAAVNIDGPAGFTDPGNVAKDDAAAFPFLTRFLGGPYAEKPDVWRRASPLTYAGPASAPLLFIHSSSDRPFQQREELSAALRAAGVPSEIVVIADTPHPFWLFQPWFEPTFAHVVRWIEGMGKAVAPPIDRRALVTRHNPVLRRLDVESPLSVGNGEFAFTADATGLQSFAEGYERTIPLATQSHWGWHTSPNPNGWSIERFRFNEFESHGRNVGYADIPGDRRTPEIEWLRANPHRLHLGQLGFLLRRSDGTAAEASDLTDVEQTLDLWNGILTSRFRLDGRPVEVETICHPRLDVVAVRVVSPLLREGRLAIRLRFAYGTGQATAADWARPEAHETVVSRPDPYAAGFARRLDADAYHVGLRWTTDAALVPGEKHSFTLEPARRAETLALTAAFSPKPMSDAPSFARVRSAASEHWNRFWLSGGAIDLSGSRDPRWRELERRIVLSQYLTAIQCAGSLPPQETGLTFNSWEGKFHLEMHWWHAAHFPLWDRLPLLEKSLGYYRAILPRARKTAQRQGYAGARWPKMTDPAGAESPSSVGPFLVWQQPHPIFYAELVHRSAPGAATLERFRDVVFETAEFMASFAAWDEAGRRYVLGPPLQCAQEVFPKDRTFNCSFELAYWRWGLEAAQRWRERLGLAREARWDQVLERLATPAVAEGKYLFAESAPETYSEGRWADDHPAVTAALGLLPGTAVDPQTMRATLRWIWERWNWDDTWGWDYPMLAMSAARLDEPALAVDALLRDAPKNFYRANGHNHQRPGLTIYLPGNGGLLYAAAMMAAGWDGAPQRHAPGFPGDGSWSVRWEGLRPGP